MGSIANDVNVDRIAVIGAGSAGLAAAKYLVAEKIFSKIIIFEQRLNVGGVWNATPNVTSDPAFSIPQTAPSSLPKDPISSDENEEYGKEGQKFQFLSPVYDALETNIPYSLMNYSDLPFPEGTSLFPRYDIVQGYLEHYADDVRHLIKFGTQVLDVRRSSHAEGGKDQWTVTTRNLTNQSKQSQVFDAVIVANGHYDDPFVPDIEGLREWNAKYPAEITHSKFYRRPEAYKDKKVLIIGSSASGTDIASQITPFCSPPLVMSVRSPPPAEFPLPEPLTILPQISRFDASTRTITFINGRTERDISAVIFCTGYLYSFPFLSSLDPPLLSRTNPGTRVQNLYEHIFYVPAPTLSFLALPQRIVPFPIAETQSAMISRFLSGRLSLPPLAVLQDWETQRLASLAQLPSNGKGFHVLGYPEDASYINALHDLAVKAVPRPERGLGNGGGGKEPPYWAERERWVRSRIAAIKSEARKRGSERWKVKTLADLGFMFDGSEKDS